MAVVGKEEEELLVVIVVVDETGRAETRARAAVGSWWGIMLRGQLGLGGGEDDRIGLEAYADAEGC